MSYDDEYNEEEAGRKPGIGRIIGRILKYIGIALILGVYLISVLRICSSRDPGEVLEFVWNEAAFAKYKESPGDFQVLAAEVAEKMDDNGKFALSGLMWLDESVMGEDKGQLQVTVRYNNSTVKWLVTEYELSGAPQGEPFIYILEDRDGNIYRDYQFTIYSKNMYNYRRLVFDGVDFTNRSGFTLRMYYIEDVDLTAGGYCSLDVWDAKEKPAAVKLGEAPSAPTSGLYENPAYLDKSAG